MDSVQSVDFHGGKCPKSEFERKFPVSLLPFVQKLIFWTGNFFYTKLFFVNRNFDLELEKFDSHGWKCPKC